MVNLYEDVVESVSFPSTNIGFGLNSYGEIFKTTDGGDFWANICDNYDFESINFPSESVGYGFFRDPLEDYYTYKTTDGGTNWILINQGIEFEQIDFLSENIGYGTTGDELYKTTDGGESWGIIYEDEEDIESISFF
jgi:photosystem II stability/assembly factor-like uncharacterized protein